MERPQLMLAICCPINFHTILRGSSPVSQTSLGFILEGRCRETDGMPEPVFPFRETTSFGGDGNVVFAGIKATQDRAMERHR